MYNFTRSAIHFYLRSLASQPAIVVVWQSHVRHRCVARVARESKKRKKHQNDCLHKYSRRFVKVKTDFFSSMAVKKRQHFSMGIFANAFKSNGENNGGAGFFSYCFIRLFCKWRMFAIFKPWTSPHI